MIRWLQPDLGPNELAAVARVFRDAWPGEGSRVKEFKQAFSEYVGVPAEELIAVTSCTEGLYQILEALTLGQRDDVLLPAVSYIGAAHAVRQCGATVTIADVDPRTLNITAPIVQQAITDKTSALVLLHYGGRAGDIADISRIAAEKNIVLVEDAACGLGASSGGKACGTFGDVGVWSFDAMKMISAGDGGMIRIRDQALRECVERNIRLGGVRPGIVGATASSDRWWEHDPVQPGRRCFMNDITASIATVQLSRIHEFIARRRELSAQYDRELAGCPALTLQPALRNDDAPYFYWIQVLGGRRDALARALLAAGIYTTFRYWPLHRTALYRSEGPFPGADLATDTTLLLPLHPSLTEENVGRVCAEILAFLSR